MSYDLMVFDPEAAPRDRDAFFDWYHRITKWDEGHDYNDPANTSPQLARWYRAMIPQFPAMNGPDGISDDDPALDSGFVTGYTCARNAIYLDFRWSVAAEAYNATLSLAALHKVGFFDVSADDGAVWLLGPNGYRIAHGGRPDERETERALEQWLATRS
jgi:hypothetical protein